MYRKNSYEEMFCKQMQDPEYAQGFLYELITFEEEPMEIEEALRVIINRMGVTDFAQMIGENKSNVASFLNGTRKLKEETLNKYLKPFKLKIKKVVEKVA